MNCQHETSRSRIECVCFSPAAAFQQAGALTFEKLCTPYFIRFLVFAKSNKFGVS